MEALEPDIGRSRRHRYRYGGFVLTILIWLLLILLLLFMPGNRTDLFDCECLCAVQSVEPFLWNQGCCDACDQDFLETA